MPTSAKTLSDETLEPAPVYGTFDLAFRDRQAEAGRFVIVIRCGENGEIGIGHSMRPGKHALIIP